MTKYSASDAALAFRKMHGLGNDFVIIDARAREVTMSADWAAAIGDRRRGVGFDQLAIFRNGTDSDADIAFWNADGSRADACGNATRCIARLLMDESGQDRLTLRSGRGTLMCRDAGAGLVAVNMGQPQLDWRDVPLAEDLDLNALPIDGAPGAAGMGNPHMVFCVADATEIDLAAVGPGLEHHPLYPERTNVEFCHVIDRNTVRMRVWERGGMITQACGSGACAAAVVLHRQGHCDRQVKMRLDGGDLDIDWRDDGVWMTGPAAQVFEGVLDPALHPDVQP